MKRIVFCILLLLVVPLVAQADYTFYLKNGSEISAVKTYSEQEGEVTVFFGTGSMIIPKQDILRIEGSESAEENAGGEVKSGTKEPREKQGETGSPSEGTKDEKSAQRDVLQKEYDSLTDELRTTEQREMNLVTTINEKIGADKSYNTIQRKQLEKELEPLQTELSAVQNKKSELMKKRYSLEDQLRSLQ
jgi:hypothetical protein